MVLLQWIKIQLHLSKAWRAESELSFGAGQQLTVQELVLFMCQLSDKLSGT